MQQSANNALNHSHGFGQDRKRPGEIRTLMVIGVTAAMMVVEITAGLLFGSIALLADGLHMGSHTAALSINVFAYIYARRHAHDERFSLGTGKVNALGGFSGAVLLDRQAPVNIRKKVVDGIQKNGDNQVVDLHLWAVGPGIYAAIVSVCTRIPRSPEYYKQLIPSDLKLVHVTVEVNRS